MDCVPQEQGHWSRFARCDGVQHLSRRLDVTGEQGRKALIHFDQRLRDHLDGRFAQRFQLLDELLAMLNRLDEARAP